MEIDGIVGDDNAAARGFRLFNIHPGQFINLAFRHPSLKVSTGAVEVASRVGALPESPPQPVNSAAAKSPAIIPVAALCIIFIIKSLLSTGKI